MHKTVVCFLPWEEMILKILNIEELWTARLEGIVLLGYPHGSPSLERVWTEHKVLKKKQAFWLVLCP